MNWEALEVAARTARGHAHAPYSTFRVGAAVQGGSGRVYGGCNVEISSYSHTCCAERIAVFKAVSEGETRIDAVVVLTDTAPPVAPCGACRQVLHDFGPHMQVRLLNDQGGLAEFTLRELLPHAFEPSAVLSRLKGG